MDLDTLFIADTGRAFSSEFVYYIYMCKYIFASERGERRSYQQSYIDHLDDIQTLLINTGIYDRNRKKNTIRK